MAAKQPSFEHVEAVYPPEETAKILGLSLNELTGLTKEGVLVRTMRQIDGRPRIMYDWIETIPRYIAHLDSPYRQAREDYLFEKHETQRIIRAQKELELDYARGLMVKRANVILAMTKILGVVRNHVLGIPVRVARLVLGQTDIRKVMRIVTEACDLALRETETFTTNLFDEPTKNGQRKGEEGELRQRHIRRHTKKRTR